jgi:hypothetical protein
MMTWGNAPFTSIPAVAAVVLITGFSWVMAIWLLKTPLFDELALVPTHVKTWRSAGTSDSIR